MNVHFIAIGGSAMHNLAIALHKKGYRISGSDDEIFEPSRSRLEKHGILPGKIGWFPEKIQSGLDAVILGMHARIDNPELKQAKKLGVPVFSYPEYLYEQSKNKTRVVIGGSHGKTTITAMIMHVLKSCNMDFDYMVGADIDGFDTMVKITDSAKVAVFEGDEYLSSPIDRRPKFHLYHPHIGVISGIAWDHINVFPSFENYVEQFEIFAEIIENNNGHLIYYEGDKEVVRIAENRTCRKTPYREHLAENSKNQMVLKVSGHSPVRLKVFGKHNLQNINAAKIVCNNLGVSDNEFYQSIASFEGARKRLQLLAENNQTAVFLDFAHAPSKLKATTQAVKEQFSERQLVACMELHTFSSLNKAFLPQYHLSMRAADKAFVYFNPDTVKHKKLEMLAPGDIAKAFGGQNVTVFSDAQQLLDELRLQNWENTNLLLMSSGNFSGIDFNELAQKIVNSL